MTMPMAMPIAMLGFSCHEATTAVTRRKSKLWRRIAHHLKALEEIYQSYEKVRFAAYVWSVAVIVAVGSRRVVSAEMQKTKGLHAWTKQVKIEKEYTPDAKYRVVDIHGTTSCRHLFWKRKLVCSYDVFAMSDWIPTQFKTTKSSLHFHFLHTGVDGMKL